MALEGSRGQTSKLSFAARGSVEIANCGHEERKKSKARRDDEIKWDKRELEHETNLSYGVSSKNIPSFNFLLILLVTNINVATDLFLLFIIYLNGYVKLISFTSNLRDVRALFFAD